ncbi:MAG: hypothetical protein WCY30_00120 [Candidatus Neomarinimicrobiota bacterium]
MNEKIALAPLSYLRSRKAIVSARGAAIGKVTDKIKKLRSGGKNINQVSKAIKQTQKELTNINKQLLNKKNVQWWDVPGRYSRGRQMKQVSHLRSKLDVLKKTPVSEFLSDIPNQPKTRGFFNTPRKKAVGVVLGAGGLYGAGAISASQKNKSINRDYNKYYNPSQ